jgi:hypothetical protein
MITISGAAIRRDEMYKVLDNKANIVDGDFDTQEDAENFIIEDLDSDHNVFWVTDEEGDIVALVYCSTVYVPKAPATFLSV